MRDFLFACAITVIAGEARAVETMIPLDPESGVRLGQGFDAESMEWRELCVEGERSEQLSKEASVAAFETSLTSRSYDQLQGSISTGLNLVGGLFGAKAKASIFGEWTQSNKSSSSVYHLNFGTSYVWLRKVRSVLLAPQERLFKKRCGTHLAIGLGTQHEVFFFLKYLSANKEWLEKTRLDFELKLAGGLAKKKWTREKVKEGLDASAAMKVGISRGGYFRDLFRPLVDSDEFFSTDCSFENLDPCFRLSDYFFATLETIKRDIATGALGEIPLLADQVPSLVILVPYVEASIDFRSLPRGDILLSKTDHLNPLKIRLGELKSTANDELTLDPAANFALRQEIAALEKNLLKCERYNLCK